MPEPDFEVLVAEDEPAARDFLASALCSHGFRVVASVGSGRAAMAAIVEQRPEALFLDVRMPGGSGLDVARHVSRPGGPLCVFVTAHPTFAVPAFEVHAVDYLLKPFDDGRLADCCRWLKIQLANRRGGVTPHGAAPAAGTGRLVVKSGGCLRFVSWLDITHITADDYCVRVHTDGTSYHVRASLAGLQAQLPEWFVRVHRSVIVNARAVVRVDGAGHGDATATLNGGLVVRVSRDRRHTLAAGGTLPAPI